MTAAARRHLTGSTTAIKAATAAATGGAQTTDAKLAASVTLPNYYVVDTTLREGEQFSSADFTSQDRVYLAKQLDHLGVDYIELSNPLASEQAKRDCTTISSLGLNAKVVTHTRCHMDDVTAALESGVDGVSMYMATSAALRKHSHGLSIGQVLESAEQVIGFVKDAGLECRFSCEDTFRSDPSEVVHIYERVAAMGVDRVGLADTVGVATPLQVHRTVELVRAAVPEDVGIEFHAHDDTGCAVANTLLALQAGATHVNTCLLGIGERNGITPLGALLARMYTLDREATLNRFNLGILKHMEKYVANVAGISVPFNNPVTGSAAFTHKAGVHSKAVMADPSAYEVLNPEDFGVDRHIEIAHRLTGWNALRQRANELQLTVSNDQIKVATRLVKSESDEISLTVEELDTILVSIARETSSLSGTGSGDLRKQASEAGSREVAVALESAAEAMAALEAKVAQEAVFAVKANRATDGRPSIKLKVEGHLFDKAVLNRMFDIIVDSEACFQVDHLYVGERDELHSHAVLQLWAEKHEALLEVKSSLKTLITANADIADVTLIDYEG